MSGAMELPHAISSERSGQRYACSGRGRADKWAQVIMQIRRKYAAQIKFSVRAHLLVRPRPVHSAISLVSLKQLVEGTWTSAAQSPRPAIIIMYNI